MQSIRDTERKREDAIGAGVEGNLKGQAYLDQRTRRSLSRMDLQTRFEWSAVNLWGLGKKQKKGAGKRSPFSRLINWAPSCKSICRNSSARSLDTEVPGDFHGLNN